MICCGRLPKPEPHDDDFNTHRLCLNRAGENDGVFDLQVNKSDLFWIAIATDTLAADMKERPDES
jgi:hypothetical protein